MRLFPSPKSRIGKDPLLYVFSFCQHQQLKQLNNRTTRQGHPAFEHQILLFCFLLQIIYFYTFQVYILNKAQIDPVLDKVKAQFDEISGKVFAMIPQAKPAEKTE